MSSVESSNSECEYQNSDKNKRARAHRYWRDRSGLTPCATSCMMASTSDLSFGRSISKKHPKKHPLKMTHNIFFGSLSNYFTVPNFTLHHDGHVHTPSLLVIVDVVLTQTPRKDSSQHSAKQATTAASTTTILHGPYCSRKRFHGRTFV